MRIFRRYTLLVALFLQLLNVLAQGSWEEGFVITQKADTIYGFLENNDIKANLQFCNFRKTINGTVSRYEASDIRGYRFTEGKFFITKRMDDPDFKEPVFMEYLINGQANIYRFVNERFFIETVDGLEELKNSEELVEYKGDKYMKLKKEYVLLLNYFMREANMRNQIESVKFNSKSLISIAKKYHERVCDDEACIVYEKSIANKELRFRFSGGSSFSSYNFGLISDTNIGAGISGGVGVELRKLSPWVEKLSLSIDILLTRHSTFRIKSINDEIGVPVTFEGEYFVLSRNRNASYVGNDDISAPVAGSAEVAINPVTLKMPIVFNYYFNKGTLSPYVGVGGLVALELQQNEDFIYHYYLSNLDTSMPFSHFGGVARFGVAYRLNSGKEIAFETNFEQTRSSNNNRSLRLQRQVLTTGLTFLF